VTEPEAPALKKNVPTLGSPIALFFRTSSSSKSNHMRFVHFLIGSWFYHRSA